MIPGMEVNTPPSMADAIDTGIRDADGEGVSQAEKDEVKKFATEYAVQTDFDKWARQQYGLDRNYAQGLAGMKWASGANIIGAFIDILVSFLYAQNPDVSVRGAAQAGQQPNMNMTMFAETLQIVISRLWRDARLKFRIRKMVRSSLSVGPGWIKALIYSQTQRNPQLEKQMGDIRDNLDRIAKIQETLGTGVELDDDLKAKQTELMRLQQGLQRQIEKLVKRGLCVDFVRAEDMHVSLDIADIADYRDADWLANDLYITEKDAPARFKELTEDDWKRATKYMQRQTTPRARADDVADFGDSAITEGQYMKATDNPAQGGRGVGQMLGGEKPVMFVKVVECWDRRDNLIKTWVEGTEKWAIEPYEPPQATTRFYPYFLVAFFQVDGARHPQSLTWRLSKLQDEYMHTRSNGRLTRERSVPGTIFDPGEMSADEAKKVAESTVLEMIPIRPTTPGKPVSEVIAAKPIPRVDPLLWDTIPVQRDMEVLSGVQEAQAQAPQSGVTATAVETANAGFASRTGADRDSLEDMLTDLAQYTAECAIQSLTVQDAQKIAGPLAMWPGEDAALPGAPTLPIDDILAMFEVEIQAGTTGKPQARADKETWATLLPLVQQMMAQITMNEASGNPIMMAQAKGMRNLLRETLRRLDDRMPLDSILPPPVTPAIPPGAGPAPPGAALPPGAAPAVGNGTVNNPAAQQPPGTPTPPA